MKANASFWRTWPGACAIVLLAVLLFFLLTEHRAHFFGFLPFGFLLLCPVMHIFMHKGHGSHSEATNPKPNNNGDAGPAGGHHH